MFKNKNTIIGGLLIAVLFLWATMNSTKQAETLAKKKQAAEMASQDSVKAAQIAALKAKAALGPAHAEIGQAQPTLVSGTTNAVIDSSHKDLLPIQVIAPRKIVVETDKFWITLDNKGGMVRSIVAKALPNHQGVFPELIQNQDSGALSLKLDQVDFAQQFFSVDSTLKDSVRITSPLTIAFTWKNALGQSLVREYRFTKDGDSFRQFNRMQGFQAKLYTLEWKGGMRETDKIPEGKALMSAAGYFFSEVILNNSYNVERISKIKEQKWFNREEGKARWVGLRRKYIAAIINWGTESEAAIGAAPILLNAPDPGTYALTISDNLNSDTLAYNFVILPLVHSKISAIPGESYEKIMFSGWEWIGADKWFVALCGYILKLLNWFYSIIPNYGVAIILLTLLVKLITMPLTLKQLRSTREMQRHKPAMDEIRARNRANPQKVQAELMEYYRKNGVNPFAAMFGCFTMIFQMPIFIGLFVSLGRSVELRFAPFVGWIKDLSSPDVLVAALKIPYLFPEGLSLLPFLMVTTTFFQTKQTITDPNQKMMIYTMPIMMFMFSTVMPSGLIIYWIVSNLFSIIQYRIMNRNTLPVVMPAHPNMQNKAKKNQK